MDAVEFLTREASHRKDHGLHDGKAITESCTDEPKVSKFPCFEIVFLGCKCFCVCHDWGFDTPLISKEFAVNVKESHCCPQC